MTFCNYMTTVHPSFSMLRHQMRRKGEKRMTSRRWRSCGNLCSLEAGLLSPMKKIVSRDAASARPCPQGDLV
jgi:hypothetical protein